LRVLSPVADGAVESAGAAEALALAGAALAVLAGELAVGLPPHATRLSTIIMARAAVANDFISFIFIVSFILSILITNIGLPYKNTLAPLGLSETSVVAL
jgi:hypothetical protein